MARCSSSMSPARKNCRLVDTPPPSRISRLPAASVAWLQGGVKTSSDESELRAARHLDPRSRVMSHDEDGSVIRRFVTPPPFPTLVRPGASDGAEHVSPDNPGADLRETSRRDIVVDARVATFVAVHVLPGARVEDPVKQCRTPHSERIVKILAGPGTVTVD